MTRAANDPSEGSSDPKAGSRAGDTSEAAEISAQERKRPATAWRRYGAIAWNVIQVIASLTLAVTKVHDWWIS